MTTRLIEECFDLGYIEEDKYSRWIRVLIPEGAMVVIVDPYIINIEDLVRAKPGSVPLVRIRRPGWGRGDVHKYIHVIR